MSPIPTILMVPHTSGSVHYTKRYGHPELAGFFVYLFWSLPKYGRSPSFLRITGRAAYRWIGIQETSITTFGSWESVHWLRRNPSITFQTRKRSRIFWWITNIWAFPSSADCSSLFLSRLGWAKCGSCPGEMGWLVDFQGFDAFLLWMSLEC